MQIKLSNDNAIVFVDDDVTELLLARRFVEHSELKNPVLEFDTGEAFLDYMNRVANGDTAMPAMALIDGRMPRMDGWEIVESVRKHPEFDSQPIMVLFSNSDEPSDIERAREMGANGYLVKPANGDAYLDMLNAIARGTEIPSG